MSELRECPFCGSTSIDVVNGEMCYYLACADCYSHGPSTLSLADATTAWNTRRPSTREVTAIRLLTRILNNTRNIAWGVGEHDQAMQDLIKELKDE